MLCSDERYIFYCSENSVFFIKASAFGHKYQLPFVNTVAKLNYLCSPLPDT